MPKPKPPTPPPQRPAPLWQRAIERFHAPFDARTNSDYAATISDWAELPGPERQGHGMHLLFRAAGGIADIAHNLREIRILLARELPAIRRRLGELENLVDEHGSAIAAGGGGAALGDVGEEDEEQDEGEEGADGEGAELESDEDLDAEFARQQAARAPAPKPKPVVEAAVESVVPDAIQIPPKPRVHRKKPVVLEGSAS